ncbi:MAG: hypothetical protein FWH35_01900, partial [Treponema sp.]|nr:hypothetical protein [Treponema sp.]
MKKTVFFGLLVIILTFSFIGCDNGNESNNDDPSPYAGNWTGIGIDAGGNTVNVILTVYDDNSFVEKIDAFGPMSNWARGNLSV